MITMEYIRKNRYNIEKSRYEIRGIDSKREYYEEKIYELQKQLSDNERRWKDTNHLIISAQKNNNFDVTKESKIDLSAPFFKSLGVTKESIITDKKAVFVLTPFLEEESKTYMTIKEVCSDVNLNCKRGDEVFRSNDIFSHIISEIMNSRLVIVNINGRNPNVFYELGICHAIGKPVIIVSSVKDDIPFDVMAKNIVLYKDLIDLKSQLKNELLKMFIDEDNRS